MKKLLLASTLFWFAGSVFAEVATPSLDPLNKNNNPAAIGFYTNSSMGLNYLQAEGKVKQEGATEGELGDLKTSSSLPSAKLNLMGEGINAEILYSQEVKTEYELDFTAVGGSFQSEFAEKEQEQLINLSYLFTKEISFGLGYQIGKIESDEVTVIPGVSTTEFTDTYDTTTTKIGISWRLGDLFHLAGGQNLVSQKGERDSGGTTSDIENVNYSETFYGIALLSGKPGDTLFRLEYNVNESPEVINESSDGTTVDGYHRKSRDTNASLELLSGNFLLSYKLTNTSLGEVDIDTTDSSLEEFKEEIQIQKYGLGYVTNDDWIFSLYYFENKNTIEANDTTDLVLNQTGFQLNAGIAWK